MGRTLPAVLTSPQSNGAVERCVKMIKKLLSKAEGPYLSLMEYRATCTHIQWLQSSPASVWKADQNNIAGPAIHTCPKAPRPSSNICAKEVEYMEKMKTAHDQRHRAHPLPTLQPGDGYRVYIKDTRGPGVVQQHASTPALIHHYNWPGSNLLQPPWPPVSSWQPATSCPRHTITRRCATTYTTGNARTKV